MSQAVPGAVQGKNMAAAVDPKILSLLRHTLWSP